MFLPIFCLDNFDLIEETLSGAGTTHSTHGIVIQEVKRGKDQMSHDGDYQSYENEDLAPNEIEQSTSASTGLRKTKKRSVIIFRKNYLCAILKATLSPSSQFLRHLLDQHLGQLDDKDFFFGSCADLA